MKWFYSKNTKPKITEPQIPSQKILNQNLNLFKVKILDSHDRKFMKIDNTNIYRTKFFLIWWNANETKKLLQKQPFQFLRHKIFWFFLIPKCVNRKYPKRSFLKILVMAF